MLWLNYMENVMESCSNWTVSERVTWFQIIQILIFIDDDDICLCNFLKEFIILFKNLCDTILCGIIQPIKLVWFEFIYDLLHNMIHFTIKFGLIKFIKKI